MIHLVLLSGGSGTRLWPLSNETRSKQFLKVLRDDRGKHVSMVQRVFSQVGKIDAHVDITIATGESQRSSIDAQLGDMGATYSLAIEPSRRDTAPAIFLACASILWEQEASMGDTVVVMPIDTFADQAYYDMVVALDHAVQQDIAKLVLLGVKPTYPSEKYGYIVPDQMDSSMNAAVGNSESVHSYSAPELVKSFVEKPSMHEAEKLISEGALWNCGVFAFRLGYLMGLIQQYVDVDSYADLHRRYSDLPKNSFDYEVVEKEDYIAVISYAGTWKDLGTWNTLTDEMVDYADGRVVGIDTCQNTYAINELNIPLITLGLNDAVVVATPDGVLVSDKDASAQMRPYVSEAAKSRPMYERRQWGEYRVLDLGVYEDGRKALTKELVIDAGCQLSYQRHMHRTEVWTIVSGEGMIALDGSVFQVVPGSVVTINAGQQHSVRASSQLHIIEVQIGDALEETDIERFGSFWSQEADEVS